MQEGIDNVFSIIDSVISLAILLAFTVGFIRGDIVSRKSVEEIIAKTIDAIGASRDRDF